MDVKVDTSPDSTVAGGDTFKVTLGSEKFTVVGEDHLEEFRTAVESGKAIDEVLSVLQRNSAYQDLDLPNEGFLSSLGKQSEIDALMEGETRPEVYIVVRTSQSNEAGDPKAQGFTRVLLKFEDGHYVLKRDEDIKHKDSARLLPNDKLILMRPASIN